MEQAEMGNAQLGVSQEGQLRIQQGLIRKEDMQRLPSNQERRGGGIAGTGKSDAPKPWIWRSSRACSPRTHRTAASGRNHEQAASCAGRPRFRVGKAGL